ncbi:MAG: epoxyqueuosine reductase QueH [Clostridiales bacterium]|nr:epoxyqueuosine reductase QueH [Clostridiales bacterium]
MEKRNYQREMEEEIKALQGRRPRLLLHSCCGPCSSAVIERLAAHFDLTIYFYNPNIEPEEEYAHRLSEQIRLLSLLPAGASLLPCPYDHEAFQAFAERMADAPEGGERCLSCFALRLDETARAAKSHGFEYFTTTLSVSPHKNAENLNRIGRAAGEKHGVKYLMADFKKKNGYLRSLELSKEYDLYRQDYCGCLYSIPRKE